ncbi:oxygen-dependent coproporphyrinogen oxidase [Tuwongella immobilis]|uniref:coproporphyrinogen oxidase n=1 Tax=Tuwongella immobilis TaxID=692036 RepID=A0A6C2YV82_9BACT|nr:oxygen-dependent coproporphyrinogen oxidase [Tuwongella immobilis]VIP05354.1 coproporphyrinogen iii oxidase : Oxygen-dependent coproporphyrinogen-III oxidase OS=Cyanothece sp. (strain PCC 7425 / ATCC 29141) GN=hemF PE=3 SV=1: Coprogen_oxidas [Tuwongella immobilis]VTS08064.1 coproporphyrinogen iii oxidase : Oxygen-dependent coproporphyrinogen-III oxidase OS=Cyanothece sp. (strain PCC 7425 / ATCC 29141) GN=hemF PE=3 SV=1: Coprogen_oxidas [Tuwongella immobilis]
MTTHSMHPEAVTYFRDLQDRICAAIEQVDGGGKFQEDSWERPGGGGGRSRVMTEGKVFEKAGVGFSEVYGEMSADFAKQLPGDGTNFTATGVSLVFHPRSPLVPTVHANFRFLTKGERWWFGGGGDLTPYYPFLEDVVHFHRTWKAVCDKHAPLADYAKMKHDCDEYFFLHHRGEARGVGGIFFDYLSGDAERTFAFVKDAGSAFVESYVPIAERRKGLEYTPQQRQFQEYRRGRYVEFNLVYDRGTIFGLKTAGRIESILMSLPPHVQWIYDYRPEAGTPEAKLTEYWLKPRDWANEPLPQST